MITIVALTLVALAACAIVTWPIWQSIRRPWFWQATDGVDEVLQQEQRAALEALRDLAMDFKLGKLGAADYRALAAPLQERARRTLQAQAASKDARTHVSPELDAQLEAAILAARRVSAPAGAQPGVTRYCPQCGAPAAPEFRFCAACGARLPVAAVHQPPVNEQAQPAAAAVHSAAVTPPVTNGHTAIPPTPPAAPSSTVETIIAPPATRPARRWLWSAAAVVALAWVAGAIWLFVSSRTGQQSQTPIATLPNVRVQSLVVADRLSVLGEPGGVQLSSDNQTWQAASLTDDIRALVVLDPAGEQWLAAGAQGLWRSQDGAKTWQLVATTPADLRLVALAAAPGQRDLLWGADTTAVYRSEDGGAQWSQVNDFPPGRPQALAAGRAALFLGTDQGVFQSTDGGESWTIYNGMVNGRIVSTQIQALAYDEPNGVIYAGTPAGLSFLRLSSPGGWGQRLLRADVTALALAGDANEIVWVGAADGRIFRSGDRGVTWR